MPLNPLIGIVAFLDTNAALRYLWDDHSEESPPAIRLIETAPAGSLFLSEVVVAEIVWSMHRHDSRTAIVDALQRLLANESIWADSLLGEAVYNYSRTNLDFADCLLAARAEASSLPVITYDQGFRKFKDITAQTPAQWLAVQ